MSIKTAHLTTAAVAVGEAQGLINLDVNEGIFDAEAIPALIDAVRELAASNDELVSFLRGLVDSLEAKGFDVDHTPPE